MKKNTEQAQNIELSQKHASATLPKYGLDLDSLIPAPYSALNEAEMTKHYQACETALSEVVNTCDTYTPGNICDGFVDTQMKVLYSRHSSEVGNHHYQIQRINANRETRQKILTQKEKRAQETVETCRQELEPLTDVPELFVLHFGKRRVSLALLTTVLAMAVDALLNYNFLQNILYQNAFLLLICVVGMSVMSDASMFALGKLLSYKKELSMPHWMFHIITISLAAMFLISVVAGGIMIRFGSMDATYGTVNAAGEFVGKENYSLAEYGVAIITSFLTTCTGILSFAFSMNESAPLLDKKQKLEKELAETESVLEATRAELSTLEQAPNLTEMDEDQRFAAEDALFAMQEGLKMHLRKMLALRQADPACTDQTLRTPFASISEDIPFNNEKSRMPDTLAG